MIKFIVVSINFSSYFCFFPPLLVELRVRVRQREACLDRLVMGRMFFFFFIAFSLLTLGQGTSGPLQRIYIIDIFNQSLYHLGPTLTFMNFTGIEIQVQPMALSSCCRNRLDLGSTHMNVIVESFISPPYDGGCWSILIVAMVVHL